MSEPQKNVFRRGTVLLVLVMLVIVAAGILIAHFHYAAINEAEDPRVLEAKLLYKEYNQAIRDNDAAKAMLTLDRIEAVYAAWPDYAHSYELGVVYNNRAAIYLGLLLHPVQDTVSRDSLLAEAAYWAGLSIQNYQEWLADFSDSTPEALLPETESWYTGLDDMYPEVDVARVIRKRLEDIQLAQKETPRRLSVAYTNLGIVHRHQGDYDAAIQCYRQALDLWEANRNAENNIRILLGQPTKEVSFIEKLFPADKNK